MFVLYVHKGAMRVNSNQKAFDILTPFMTSLHLSVLLWIEVSLVLLSEGGVHQLMQ